MIFLTFLLLSNFVDASTDTPNVLLIDSSFLPISLSSGKKTPDSCLLISENSEEISTLGACFEEKYWNQANLVNMNFIKGFQDYVGGKKESSYSKEWLDFQKKFPQQAKSLRNSYIVAAHGSRSAFSC